MTWAQDPGSTSVVDSLAITVLHITIDWVLCLALRERKMSMRGCFWEFANIKALTCEHDGLQIAFQSSQGRHHSPRQHKQSSFCLEPRFWGWRRLAPCWELSCFLALQRPHFVAAACPIHKSKFWLWSVWPSQRTGVMPGMSRNKSNLSMMWLDMFWKATKRPIWQTFTMPW